MPSRRDVWNSEYSRDGSEEPGAPWLLFLFLRAAAATADAVA